MTADPSARLLSLPAHSPVEIWWSDRAGKWTEARSVRWHPGPGDDWAVPLERLPHWDSHHIHRLRITIRDPGTVDVGVPRLLR